MLHKKFAFCTATALLAAAVACSDSPDSPAAPAGTPPASGNAAPDGSTLKVSAPTPQSPVNNAQPQTLMLVAGTSAPLFANGNPPALTYEFQVLTTGGTVVNACTTTASPAGNRVSASPSCALEFDTNYRWRVRARLGAAVGPWSEATFKSPAGGFLNEQGVYDPLINGTTVGEIVGDVTFIPGVGVRLNNAESHIRYPLPRTIVQGEFSLVVTGVATNTEGDKTKIMGMSEGLSDIVTNDRRMTVEKRGNPEGIVAWRFISRDDQVDTEGAEREFVPFDENLPYLWTATWRDQFFNVEIQRGGGSGESIYSKGKHYDGAYDPNPHFAFIGSPIGRSGPTAATVPGMIVRHVWISANPRPAGLPSQ